MPLFFADGRAFVTGSQSNVFYIPTPAEPKARLVLRVTIEGLTTQAMVDTGLVSLFACQRGARAPSGCDPGARDADDSLPRRACGGTLHRLTLTLLAEEGEDLQLDVTAFVPDASYEGVPELPSILGLYGCLERVRFAFDPATDTFYFGPASPAV